MGRAKARHNEAIQVAFSFDSGTDERAPSATVPSTPKARTPRAIRASASVAHATPVEAPAKRTKQVAEHKPRASVRLKVAATSAVETPAPAPQPKAKRAAPAPTQPIVQPAKAKRAVRPKPEQETQGHAPPAQPTPRKQRRATQGRTPTVETAPVAEASAKASIAKPRGRKNAVTEVVRSEAVPATPRAPRKQARPPTPEPSNEGASDTTNAPNTTPRDVPTGPMFLMSFDDSPKRTVAEKIEAAMAAYQTRFARRPNLVLVNANVASEVEVPDVAIERRSTVPPNNFWAGIQTVPRVVAAE
jgi:hypothetical protein